MTLRGNTGDFPLETVLRLLAETHKTGELALRGSSRGDGALGLADGRVIAAVFGEEKPIPALGSIWGLGRVDFEFTPWNDAPPANLEGELEENLRRADEYRRWIESVREVIPTDRTRFRLSERAAEQGAVTFTSDRWRVVLAVNGQRDVTSVAEHLKVDRDAALTTLAGLVRDGVVETIEPPAETQAPPAPSPPAAEEFSFTPLPSEPAPLPSEPAPLPAAEPAPEPPAAAAPPEPADWTAALLEKRRQQEIASAPPPPEWTPPSAMPDRPTWSSPPPAPGTEEWTPPPTSAPESRPTIDTSGDSWTPPVPSTEAPRWTAPVESPETTWTPPPTPADVPPWTAPAESVQEWSPPAPAEPVAAEPAAPESDEWATSTKDSAAPALDDRLAALEGLFNPPAETTTPTPPAQEWTIPSPPPVAQPPSAHVPPAAEAAAASEWAPPPTVEPRAPERKRGIFGGLFGGRRDEQSAMRVAGPSDAGASTTAGMLASFSNALLNEYNSGQYGRTKVDDRIPSLLMRVDEQADPIDKPLPVVDDRLDVQALERVGLPESQAVPYLAMLVSTIYADAEKTFGKDKARRGYKIAQMQTFHGDFSVLNGLAGKLPKV